MKSKWLILLLAICMAAAPVWAEEGALQPAGEETLFAAEETASETALPSDPEGTAEDQSPVDADAPTADGVEESAGKTSAPDAPDEADPAEEEAPDAPTEAETSGETPADNESASPEEQTQDGPETEDEEPVEETEEPDEETEESGVEAEEPDGETEAPGEEAEEAPVGAPSWDGEVAPGECWQGEWDGETREKTLRLYVPYDMDAELRTEGLAVRLTLTRTSDGETRMFQPVQEGTDLRPVEARVRLTRGEYSLRLEKVNESDAGVCRLWITEAAPETEETPEEAPAVEESLPEDGDDAAAPEETEEAPQADQETPEIREDGTEPEDADMPDGPEETDETAAEDTDGLASDALPDDTDANATEEDVTVTVTAVCSGDEVVLTARVTGCDPALVTVEWQYSPDGGQTVFSVADCHDFEYRFTIGEENRAYLWRAAVTRVGEAPEADTAPDGE